jgi:transposase
MRCARLQFSAGYHRGRCSRTSHASRVDGRVVFNDILWILRRGARWRDLPEGFGPNTTVVDAGRLTLPGSKSIVRAHARARSSAGRALDF